MIPVVYWLVLFSIIFHGLSIPALDAFYRYKGVAPIVEEEPAEVRQRSVAEALPANSYVNPKRQSVIVHNRFSRPISGATLQRWNTEDSYTSHEDMRREGGYVPPYLEKPDNQALYPKAGVQDVTYRQ